MPYYEFIGKGEWNDFVITSLFIAAIFLSFLIKKMAAMNKEVITKSLSLQITYCLGQRN